jgi:hypothetical protein
VCVSLSLGELEARCSVLPRTWPRPCGSLAGEYEEPDKD